LWGGGATEERWRRLPSKVKSVKKGKNQMTRRMATRKGEEIRQKRRQACGEFQIIGRDHEAPAGKQQGYAKKHLGVKKGRGGESKIKGTNRTNKSQGATKHTTKTGGAKNETVKKNTQSGRVGTGQNVAKGEIKKRDSPKISHRKWRIEKKNEGNANNKCPTLYAPEKNW